MAQQWFYKIMGQQFGSISSYMGRILLACIIALATQLLPVKQGLCAEEPSANNSPSASNAADDLEKKIYQSVKDFGVFGPGGVKILLRWSALGNAMSCIKNFLRRRKM